MCKWGALSPVFFLASQVAPYDFSKAPNLALKRYFAFILFFLYGGQIGEGDKLRNEYWLVVIINRH